MPLSDLLDERRPHRADAARNFDAILTAASRVHRTAPTQRSTMSHAARKWAWRPYTDSSPHAAI
jgi:hypothetical protein